MQLLSPRESVPRGPVASAAHEDPGDGAARLRISPDMFANLVGFQFVPREHREIPAAFDEAEDVGCAKDTRKISPPYIFIIYIPCCGAIPHGEVAERPGHPPGE